MNPKQLTPEDFCAYDDIETPMQQARKLLHVAWKPVPKESVCRLHIGGAIDSTYYAENAAVKCTEADIEASRSAA